jgi:hypothetical protein
MEVAAIPMQFYLRIWSLNLRTRCGCLCCCYTGLHAQLLQQASFLRTERTLAKDGSLVRESPLSKTRQEYEQQGYK